MAGIFRFMLATLVAAAHLVSDPYTEHFGYFAVGGFFVISGFAMTAALNDVYQFRSGPFWRSRFWRLMPLYILACLATAAVIMVWPAHAHHFFARWSIAPTSSDIVDNLTILPMAFGDARFRYLEQSWSLAVEIVMYGLLFIGVARSARLAAWAFGAGVMYHLVCFILEQPFGERYFSMGSALLPFGLGSLTFFLLRVGAARVTIAGGATIALTWLANLVVWGAILPVEESLTFGYYANLFIVALLIIATHDRRPGPLLKRLDKALGEFSYPVYLTHWIGAFLAHQYFITSEERGWELFAVGMVCTFLIAGLFATAQALLFDPLRRKLRNASIDGRHERSAI